MKVIYIYKKKKIAVNVLMLVRSHTFNIKFLHCELRLLRKETNTSEAEM